MQRLSARIQEKDIFDMDSTEGTLMISLNLMSQLSLKPTQYLFPPKKWGPERLTVSAHRYIQWN